MARPSALADDIQSFLCEQGLGAAIGRTHRLRLGHLCSLLLHLLRRHANAGADALPQRKALQRQLRSFVALGNCLETGGDTDVPILERGMVHITFLPQVVQHFLCCDDRQFSANHLDAVLREVVPPTEDRPVRPRRRQHRRRAQQLEHLPMPLPLEGPEARPADDLVVAAAAVVQVQAPHDAGDLQVVAGTTQESDCEIRAHMFSLSFGRRILLGGSDNRIQPGMVVQCVQYVPIIPTRTSSECGGWSTRGTGFGIAGTTTRRSTTKRELLWARPCELTATWSAL